LKPGSLPARFNLAKAYELGGRESDARAQSEQATELAKKVRDSMTWRTKSRPGLPSICQPDPQDDQKALGLA
jgi:hypothetical protein